MLRRLLQWGPKKGYQFDLHGVDANPHIVAFAQQHNAHHPQIRFQAANVLDASFGQQQFDVIIATLFVHHFPQPTLVALFRQWKKQALVGIVINDLHRHALAYHSIRWLTRLFSRSGMVKYDAPLSVRRGFLRSELEHALREAGIEKYELRWRWAFRWQLVIWTTP
jgi:2-polyprenyl-3-methyl-5-hydroxy-6-metoxy-1,4-benzoquinol methylase